MREGGCENGKKNESRRAQNQQQEHGMGTRAASREETKAEAGEIEVGTEEVFSQFSLTLCFRI